MIAGYGNKREAVKRCFLYFRGGQLIIIKIPALKEIACLCIEIYVRMSFVNIVPLLCVYIIVDITENDKVKPFKESAPKVMKRKSSVSLGHLGSGGL